MNQRCIVRCPYALQSGVQQRKMAFTYLSIPAKMVRGDVPYYMKIWPSGRNLRNFTRFFSVSNSLIIFCYRVKKLAY